MRLAAFLLLWALAPGQCYGGRCRSSHWDHVEAYGTIYCDAQKTETPVDGTVVLMESDQKYNDVAEKLANAGGPQSESAQLLGSRGRFEVGGWVTDGIFNWFAEPYLDVTGTCYYDGEPRRIHEIYGLPCDHDCKNVHIYRDIDIILDGTNDREICETGKTWKDPN